MLSFGYGPPWFSDDAPRISAGVSRCIRNMGSRKTSKAMANIAGFGRGDFVPARFFYLCRRFFFRKAAVITKIEFVHYREPSGEDSPIFLLFLINKFSNAILKFG
jgi:hypothetical protein